MEDFDINKISAFRNVSTLSKLQRNNKKLIYIDETENGSLHGYSMNEKHKNEFNKKYNGSSESDTWKEYNKDLEKEIKKITG
ncbi:hypothetical protein KA005_37965 [bacterium]|nr:hypothetical protein [bacterium]